MRSATLLALLPLAAAAPHSSRPAISRRAPIHTPRNAKVIEDEYIVRMKKDIVKGTVEGLTEKLTAKPFYKYTAWNGFAAKITAEELETLRADPSVDYIEKNAEIKMYGEQTDAPWGLARLSNKEPGSTTYSYDDTAGEGTCAYIVDTGIDVKHEEFEGRAEWLENFADESDSDGQGHGTHVAGTIGSKTYGVSKKAKLFAVKVLDNQGSGTNAGVIAGMEYVVTDAPSRECPNGVVVNMSLGGGFAKAVNDAAAAIVEAGHFLAVAAGNDGADSAAYSPASEPSACTVGATDEKDAIADFSNFGKLVDILAPGVGILSTIPNGQTDTFDGTSMASPHIAGLAAYLLGLGEAPKDPQELCSFIGESAIKGAVSGVPNGTANLLAQNGQAA